jgi:hypothetical protein
LRSTARASSRDGGVSDQANTPPQGSPVNHTRNPSTWRWRSQLLQQGQRRLSAAIGNRPLAAIRSSVAVNTQRVGSEFRGPRRSSRSRRYETPFAGWSCARLVTPSPNDRRLEGASTATLLTAECRFRHGEVAQAVASATAPRRSERRHHAGQGCGTGSCERRGNPQPSLSTARKHCRQALAARVAGLRPCTTAGS